MLFLVIIIGCLYKISAAKLTMKIERYGAKSSQSICCNRPKQHFLMIFPMFSTFLASFSALGMLFFRSMPSGDMFSSFTCSGCLSPNFQVVVIIFPHRVGTFRYRFSCITAARSICNDYLCTVVLY